MTASGAGPRVSWSAKPLDPNAKAVPGIDEADIYYGDLGNSVVFVVWSDARGFGQWRHRSSGDDGVCTGSLTSPDNLSVSWKCRIKNGRADTIKLGGRDYDLKSGSLFLVSMSGKQVRVKQLDHSALKSLTPGAVAQTLEGLAKSVPAIRAFFTGAEGKE